jgi:hypothetical protein
MGRIHANPPFSHLHTLRHPAHVGCTTWGVPLPSHPPTPSCGGAPPHVSPQIHTKAHTTPCCCLSPPSSRFRFTLPLTSRVHPCLPHVKYIDVDCVSNTTQDLLVESQLGAGCNDHALSMHYAITTYGVYCVASWTYILFLSSRWQQEKQLQSNDHNN